MRYTLAKFILALNDADNRIAAIKDISHEELGQVFVRARSTTGIAQNHTITADPMTAVAKIISSCSRLSTNPDLVSR